MGINPFFMRFANETFSYQFFTPVARQGFFHPLAGMDIRL